MICFLKDIWSIYRNYLLKEAIQENDKSLSQDNYRLKVEIFTIYPRCKFWSNWPFVTAAYKKINQIGRKSLNR